MSGDPRQAGPPRARRRWWRMLLLLPLLLLALLALLALALWLALPPERAVPMLLTRIGATMGLEISAEGDAATRLGRHPVIVVRDLVARAPGASRPLLRARRMEVAVPWRTIRGLGDPLELVRIELDAPELDLPALQHWLASRPPGTGRLPVLDEGLQVRDGRIEGDGWRLDALALSLGTLRHDAPVRARISGRYADSGTRAPFALAATLQRPDSGRGFAVVGGVSPARDGWSLPSRVTLSGALHWEGGLALLPARFGAAGRYLSGDTSIPFALGLHGPLRGHGSAWTLLPAGVALRGGGMVPELDACGRLALGRRLLLEIDGRIAQWPAGWPVLPPPLGASRQPLALTARYLGPLDLRAPLGLGVARDDLRFDGRLDVPGLVAWASNPGQGSLLPPVDGQLEAEAMEISGARLEGVRIEFEDEASPTP
ncbi:hypothetical protein [Luteimonas sp. SDU82]|uniref:hypothetical protein n=2 Tax=unclassified Luteimonas TaxID=2629088 RepID=UPI003EBAB864